MIPRMVSAMLDGIGASSIRTMTITYGGKLVRPREGTG